MNTALSSSLAVVIVLAIASPESLAAGAQVRQGKVGQGLMRTQGLQKNSTAGDNAEQDKDWLSTPLAGKPDQPRGSSMLISLAFMALIAAALVAAVVWQKYRHPSVFGLGTERLDILATRHLGNKERLVLIETCGERLLLASAQGELSLLSHLPGRDFASEEKVEAAPQQHFDTLQGTYNAVAQDNKAAVPTHPSTRQASSSQPHLSFETAEKNKLEEPNMPQQHLCGDVAGLRSWQQKSTFKQPGHGESS